MMRLPEHYRRPVFIAILIHIALFSILIFNFAPAMFRAPPASAPMQTIHATAIVQMPSQPIPQSVSSDRSAHTKPLPKPISSDKSTHAKPLPKPISSDKSTHTKPLPKPISSDRSARASKRVITEKLKKEKAAKLAQAKKLKAEQKVLQQKLMQQAMMTEQKSITKADSQIQSQAQQGAIDKYKAQILALVQSNWRIDRVNDKLKCIYSVSLAPDGSVLSVSLVKSSGDDNLDQSARQAIMQSSPLPVPQNSAEFDHFRQLVLTLSPQGFVTG